MTIVDTTSQAQRAILRAVEGYVCTHPIAVHEEIQKDGTVNVHVTAGDPAAEREAVRELADLLHLQARTTLHGRFAAFNWPGPSEDFGGLTFTRWSGRNDGQAVVWAGRSPVRPCGACGNWPCTCVKPSPAPGTGGSAAA